MRKPLLLVFFLLLVAGNCWSADIFITQNTSGTDSGANCDNAHSASWFNSNAAGGNIYHLCGTFTAASANTSMLTVPASGSAGNILTILFEADAVLTSPQWSENGAIYINNKNYVTVDGGTNGAITATNNGTGKTYHTSSSGVNVIGSYIIIKNLNITNIYQNSGSSSGATDEDGYLTWCIAVASTGDGNITIENNHTSQAHAGIQFGFTNSGGTNIYLRNNTTRNHGWGFYVTCNEDSDVVISNFNISGNDVSDWTDWQYPEAYHQDGIMISGAGITSTTPINVFGNFVHGSIIGASVTSPIFCTYNGITFPGPRVNIYNNLILSEDGGNMPGPSIGGGTIYNIYNNTIVLDSTKNNVGIILNSTNTVVNLVNNIFEHCKYAVHIPSSPGASIGLADYNVYYDVGDGAHFSGDYWGGGGTSWRDTFNDWQTASGHEHDAHGYYADPTFVSSTNLHLQAGSPAIDHGNSTISAISFSTDYSGTSRPTGAWDIGAYEYVAPTGAGGIFTGTSTGTIQ